MSLEDGKNVFVEDGLREDRRENRCKRQTER
jgi:hypothetical protein